MSAKKPITPTASSAEERIEADGTWSLRLYVAGHSPKCVAAVRNLTRFCDQHLPGRHSIEVVDLLQDPRLARDDQIVAIPTLVRKQPKPLRRVVGDLSNTERVRAGLDLLSQEDVAR
jgi:circadian clock protein KaiB